jgi:holo-[acyl-carrier protein] synthase
MRPGVDLVETARIARAITRQGEAFLKRVYTDQERAYCEGRANATASYAARWAAKEAVAKAFGTGIGDAAAMHEIEVVPTASGAPTIVLHGAAAATAAAMGVRSVEVSLTHTDAYAAAFVILIL